MQKITKVILVFCILISTSCVSKKNIIYFQNDEVNQSLINEEYKIVFKPNDLVRITVSALDNEAVKPFNLSGAISDDASAQESSYLIDHAGFIEFPILGKIKLGNLTRAQAINYFKKKLSPDYIKEPTVDIKILNFSVTVLGDVKFPGRFTITNERVSVIEAIGLAGDLNISGLRNIQVKREQNNKILTYNLDLRSNKIFSSPAYYLKQNDIVYVKPNKAASQSASFNKNTGLFVSIAGILISIITLISK